MINYNEDRRLIVFLGGMTAILLGAIYIIGYKIHQCPKPQVGHCYRIQQKDYRIDRLGDFGFMTRDNKVHSPEYFSYNESIVEIDCFAVEE